MLFLTGWTCDTEYLKELKRLGWGRMMCEKFGKPYEGERWAIDNGAYQAWNNGYQWDGMEYLEKLVRMAAHGEPYFAVTPDKPTDLDSLRFSLAWRERVSGFAFPWYLAVQDGMEVEAVREVASQFSGLFIGGTKRWKRATSRSWGELSAETGLKLHYGRCSVEADVRLARKSGADSADSTFLLWERGRFREFVEMYGGKQSLQGELEL